MILKISFEKIQAFILEQPFPPAMGWESLVHCLVGQQSCKNLTVEQQKQAGLLLQEIIESSDFSRTYFDKVGRAMGRILNAPCIRELQMAIEETNTLIGRCQLLSGRQLGVVEDLEELTIKTVLSDKSPQEMVAELKVAFCNLVVLMEEDAKVLEKLSKTDQLTNLANRRGFDEYLHTYCHPEKGKGLYLIMIDIDHFKRFNDEFGHLIGDEVLTLVASLIAKATTGNKVSGSGVNLAARYGGEEFAVIMPSCTDGDCMDLAEFIRTRIQHYPLVIRNPEGDILQKDVHLTVSIGVAAIHPLWLKKLESCPHELIQAADQAMYEAKKRGRNMICQHKAYKGADGKLTSVIL